MAWFEKKPDAKPDDKSDGDLLLEKISAAIDAKLSPISTTVGELRTEWDTLKTAASKTPDKQADPQQRVSVLDNEDEAFAQRLGPLAYQNAILSARLTEGDIVSEMKESGWQEIIPDVRKILESTPIQRKAAADYPAYCRNVMDMVIGQKARSSGLRQREGSFYLENATTRGEGESTRLGNQLNWQDGKGRVHTGDEVASKLGLDADAVKAITGSEFLA